MQPGLGERDSGPPTISKDMTPGLSHPRHDSSGEGDPFSHVICVGELGACARKLAHSVEKRLLSHP